MLTMSSCDGRFFSIVLSLCLYVNHVTYSMILLSETMLIENSTIRITIDTEFNFVHINLTTPVPSPLKWTGFGFGTSQMIETYAIIIDYTFPAQQPVVYETILGDHTIGTVHSQSEIVVLSDTNDGTTRRIIMQRPIIGTYSFPTSATTIDIISAIGQRSNFPQCIGHRKPNCQHEPLAGRHISSLVFNELQTSNEPTIHPTVIPTINPTVIPTFKPSMFPTLKPTNTPSINTTTTPTLRPIINPVESPTLTMSSIVPIIKKLTTDDPSFHPSMAPTMSPTTGHISTMSPTPYPTNETSQSVIYTTKPITTVPYMYSTKYVDPFTPTRKTSVNDAVIVCDDDTECAKDIICAEGDCHIICNSDDSCKLRNIYDNNAQSLSIECNGINSCQQANIFGGDLLYVVVKCIGLGSCKGTAFYGNDTNLLSVDCVNTNGSCQDMKIYCPLHGKQCVVSSDGVYSGDIHTHLEFYAVRGFDDLDVSEYKATLVNGSNVMYCGVDYESFCTLNESLLCDCEYESIEIKIDYADMAGFIAVLCVVLVLGMACVGLCMFFVHSLWNANEETQNKTKYKSVHIEYRQTKNIQSIKQYHGELQAIQEEDTDDTDDSDYDKTSLYPFNAVQSHSLAHEDKRTESVLKYI
eukprot:100524_1